MRRAFVEEAARVTIWTAALCLATLLGTAVYISASFAAGTEYHTQDSQASQISGQASGPVTPADADVEAQLAKAREQLDQAARRVAELSAQLGMANEQFLVTRGFRRGVVGLQIDPASGSDGARVLEVSPGGPASDGGVRPGDIIVAVNGASISGRDTARQVVQHMRDLPPNAPVEFRVMRAGKAQQLELTTRPAFAVAFGSSLAGDGGPTIAAFSAAPAAPDAPGAAVAVPPFANLPYFQALTAETAGMELTALTPALGKYFGTDAGVLVIRAPTDDAFRLQDGDVILSIDGRKPLSGTHATRILSSYQPGERITLRIMRQRKPMSLTITLPGTPPGGSPNTLPEPAPR